MKNIHKYILIVLICGLIFFILGYPCRELFRISETTEVRIVAALPLLFGISFGFAGVLGCAIANLIADIMSGYDAIIFIPGFFVQIIYGYVPAVIWKARQDLQERAVHAHRHPRFACGSVHGRKRHQTKI